MLKLYGERNTNTNYMSKIIDLNLRVRQMEGVVPPVVMMIQNLLPGREMVRDIYFQITYNRNLGWKHSCVESIETIKKKVQDLDSMLFLTITKNPYSWLLSLYRRPYSKYHKKEPDFLSFLQSPWKSLGRSNTNRLLNNPVELWNVKNRSYLNLSTLNTLNITTECIFQDPKALIDQLGKQFLIEKKSESFIDYVPSTKDSSKDTHYYRDYYLNEKWREDLSPEAIGIINRSLDSELMAYFGYEFLS